MTSDELDALFPVTVPVDVERCPICGAPIVIEGVDDLPVIESGDAWIDEHSSIQLDCSSAPDIDSDDFDDYMRGHWSMPYVDWMPVEIRLRQWLCKQGTLETVRAMGRRVS